MKIPFQSSDLTFCDIFRVNFYFLEYLLFWLSLIYYKTDIYNICQGYLIIKVKIEYHFVWKSILRLIEIQIWFQVKFSFKHIQLQLWILC